MGDSGLSHSWIWTTAAAAIIAGTLFGPRVLLIPAPEAPQAELSRPLLGPAANGRLDDRSEAAVALTRSGLGSRGGTAPGTSPAVAAPAVADLPGGASSVSGPAPGRVDEPAARPWAPKRLATRAESAVGDLKEEVAGELSCSFVASVLRWRDAPRSSHYRGNSTSKPAALPPCGRQGGR